MKKLITHSELQTAKDCLQKWQWRYQIGWRKRITSPSTLFGSAMHRALENYYLGIATDQRFNEILADGLSAIEQTLLSYIRSHADQIPEAEQQPYIDIMLLTQRVFRNYIDHYHGLDFVPARDPITSDPLVEVEFRIPVYTPAGRASSLFTLGGKIDAVVEYNGEWWILEHKTRDLIAESSYQRLVLDQQTRAYCWAAQVYFGHSIAGVIYNLIRRKEPGTPHINKDGTISVQKCDMLVDDYTATLKKQDEYLRSLDPAERKAKKFAEGLTWEKYADEIERLKTVKFFDRHFQRYTEKDYRDIQMEIYQVSLGLHQAVWFPKNDAACDHWGGCAYRELCMGLDPAGIYDLIDDPKKRHSELNQVYFHIPMGRGYQIELNPETVGFDGILESVNA